MTTTSGKRFVKGNDNPSQCYNSMTCTVCGALVGDDYLKVHAKVCKKPPTKKEQEERKKWFNIAAYRASRMRCK